MLPLSACDSVETGHNTAVPTAQVCGTAQQWSKLKPPSSRARAVLTTALETTMGAPAHMRGLLLFRACLKPVGAKNNFWTSHREIRTRAVYSCFGSASTTLEVAVVCHPNRRRRRIEMCLCHHFSSWFLPRPRWGGTCLNPWSDTDGSFAALAIPAFVRGATDGATHAWFEEDGASLPS